MSVEKIGTLDIGAHFSKIEGSVEATIEDNGDFYERMKTLSDKDLVVMDAIIKGSLG